LVPPVQGAKDFIAALYRATSASVLPNFAKLWLANLCNYAPKKTAISKYHTWHLPLDNYAGGGNRNTEKKSLTDSACISEPMTTSVARTELCKITPHILWQQISSRSCSFDIASTPSECITT